MHVSARLRALRPSQITVQTVNELVRPGRLTPAEQRALSSYLEAHARALAPEVATAWAARLAATRSGYAVVSPRSPGSPAVEHVARAGGTFWMDSLDGDAAQHALVLDMIRIGQREGFRVGLHLSAGRSPSLAIRTIAGELGVRPEALDPWLSVFASGAFGSVWSQDHGWHTADGRELRVAPMLSERARRRAKAFQSDHGCHRTVGDGFLGLVGVEGASVGLLQLGEALGVPTRELDVYLEGGDLLVGAHRDGRPFALIGRDSLVLACFALDEAGRLDDTTKWDRGPFSERQLSETRRNLSRAERRRRRGAAGTFLGKLGMAAAIVAEQLVVAPSDLHVLTQPAAHLDQALALIGPGEVALNDHEAWIPILDGILQRPDLSEDERADVAQLRGETARLHDQLGPVLDTVETELEAGGLHVERVAGATGRYRPDPSADDIDWITELDFLNFIGLLGANGEPVCISNACHLPGVQEAFEGQMRDRFGFARVYFVGGERVPGDLRMLGHNFAEVSRRAAGGILCRSRWQPPAP